MKLFALTVLLTVILAEICANPLGGPNALEKRNFFKNLGKQISKGWDKVEDLGDKVVDVFKGKPKSPPPPPAAPAPAPVVVPVLSTTTTTTTTPAPVIYEPEYKSNQHDFHEDEGSVFVQRPEELDDDADEGFDAVEFEHFDKSKHLDNLDFEEEGSIFPHRPEELDHDDEDFDAVKFIHFSDPQNDDNEDYDYDENDDDEEDALPLKKSNRFDFDHDDDEETFYEENDGDFDAVKFGHFEEQRDDDDEDYDYDENDDGDDEEDALPLKKSNHFDFGHDDNEETFHDALDHFPEESNRFNYY